MLGQPSPSDALDLAVRLVCVARLISIAELLVDRAELRPGGLLDWQVAGLTHPPIRSRLDPHLRRLAPRVDHRVFAALLGVNAVVCGVLIWRPASVWLLVLAALLLLAEMRRHPLAVDGADQMMLLLLVATVLGRSSGSATGEWAATVFVAVEVCIAYFVSGFYKATSTFWQTERAVAVIAQTRAFGYPRLAPLLHRSRRTSRLAGLVMIGWEIGFVLALVAPPPVLAAFLVAGLGFHLACALVMRLNTFIWVFAAAYPSVVVTNAWLRDAVGTPGPALTALGLAMVAAMVALLMRSLHFDTLPLPSRRA